MGVTLYTVGHSNRSLDDFLQLLEAHGIAAIVDVRRYPGSRRHPHFSREPLSASLAKRGVEYVHEPRLGGRRKPQPGSPNGHWRNDQFRAYADHLATRELRDAVDAVLARAEHTPTALMCAEAVPWQCHRQLIADRLVASGHRVRHILSPQRADPHVLNPAAVLQDDGHLIYPPAGQLDLLE